MLDNDKDKPLGGIFAGKIPPVLVVAMFVAVVWMAFRIVTTVSPLMGSDEFAYLQTAHFDARHDLLFQLDPNMQRVENRVVPWLYAASASMAPTRANDTWRLANAIGFCLGAALIFAMLRRPLGERVAAATAVLYLLFPFSFFATLILPELPFQLFIYLLAWLLTRRDGPPTLLTLCAAAVLCGLGYQIKPHAVAAVLATAAFAAAWELRVARHSVAKRLVLALARAVGFLVVTVLATKAWHALLSLGHGGGEVMSNFYASYIKRLADPTYLLAHAGSVTVYALAHLLVMAAFFAPALAWLSTRIGSLWRPATWRTREPAAADSLAMFVALFTVAMVAMVALFTDVAVAQESSEPYRMHGRYLAALFPLLLGVALAGAAERRSGRWVALAGFAATASTFYLGNRYLRIYPWDYPELMALFRPREGHWSFDGWLRWPATVTLAAGLVCWSLYALGRRAAYVAFFAIAMVCGQLQMSRWIAAQSAVAVPIVSDGRAIADYLGGHPREGSGVVVTRQRWAEITYLLAALDSLQHVMLVDGQKPIRTTDLPGNVSWVVVEPGIDDVMFAGAAELHFGRHRLFLLRDDVPWPITGQKAVWKGEPMSIALAELPIGAHLEGFNAPEPWGAWTGNKDSAAVSLPVGVSGPVVVRFFGWLPDPNGGDVEVSLGDASSTVHVGGTGADHEVRLDVPAQSDRLYFKAPMILNDGGRPLGVAISRVTLEKAH
jgi:hypothetical protein